MSAIAVRELPPLRLSHLITTPGGQHYTWREGGSRKYVPSDVEFSSTAVGGYKDGSASLARLREELFPDLEPLSTWTVQGAAGEIVGEYRLEDIPVQEGDNFSIQPQARGWQAALDDRSDVTEMFIDCDLSQQGEVPPAHQVLIRSLGYTPIDSGVVTQNVPSGLPELLQEVVFGGTDKPWCGNLYDAGPGNEIGSVLYSSTIDGWSPPSGLDAYITIRTVAQEAAVSGNLGQTADIEASGSGTLTATGPGGRYCITEFQYNAAATAANITYMKHWRKLTFVGRQGLALMTDASGNVGFLASDIIKFLIGKYAIGLRVVAGQTVVPTSLVLNQSAYKTRSKVSEILSDVNKYHLRDWAVWHGRWPNDPTFYYTPRGQGKSKRWRARVGPSKLSDTGQSMGRIWNGVFIGYQDVDGSQRYVGPTGSNADFTSSLLTDSDPLNPSNKRGIKKWIVVDMGMVSTPANAIEVGRRFLEQTKLLDTSGQATLTGYVLDDKGGLHPAHHVQGGDYVSFIDAADTSYRRIVEKNYSHSDKAVRVDLDAPPDGFQAVLDRLQLSIVDLGL